MKYSLAFGRMKLGNQPPFTQNWESLHRWIQEISVWRHWPQKFEWFHERIGYRRYRKFKPFSPGRYSTAQWWPGGYGRFSGLRVMMGGHYHAARYTGERLTPEDYLTERGLTNTKARRSG